MEQGKVCTKCGEWKIFDEFYKNNRNKKDGRMSWCKDCDKRKLNKFHKENPNYRKEYNEKYFNENKEKIKESSKSYYYDNQEKLLRQKKEYYYTNHNLLKERNNIYNRKHSERKRKYLQQWRKNNPDYHKNRTEYNTQWYNQNSQRLSEHRKILRKENPEKYKELSYISNIKRRSYKHKIIFKHHERLEILSRDNWTCQCCGIKVHDRSIGDWNTPDKAHIDHIIPISKGGNSEPDNLQVLCRTCNLSKKDKIEEYITNKMAVL